MTTPLLRNNLGETNTPKMGYYESRKWASKEYFQDHARLRKYGITAKQFNDMLSAQNGLCAICKKPETALGRGGIVKPLSVDHNHTTNKVRGLLCDRCNRMLGWYEQEMYGIHAYIAGAE